MLCILESLLLICKIHQWRSMRRSGVLLHVGADWPATPCRRLQLLVGGKTDRVKGKPVRAERIPAAICLHCGEPMFSRDTTERVRRMVHGEAKPITSIQMDVFAYR
jgi:hypothetical protein